MISHNFNLRQAVFRKLLRFHEKPAKIDYDELQQQCGRESVRLLKKVLAHRSLLDFQIAHFAARGVDKIHPTALNVLRIGFAELHLLKEKPHAAVYEAVELISKKHDHLKGFVNAVLRGSQRKPLAEVVRFETNPLEHLAVATSHPTWLVEAWLQTFGETTTRMICLANNENPPLCIRINSLSKNQDDLIQTLQSCCETVQPSQLVEHAIIVQGMPALTEAPLATPWQNGALYFQNEAAQVVAKILAPAPGSVAVDLCSAPGGKATHMAALMRDQGTVYAIDRSQQKLKYLQENITRLQLQSIRPLCMDVLSDEAIEYIRQADYVVLDPPCSGFGIIRKAPECKWLKTVDDVHRLAASQEQLLCHTIAAMKPGARAAYSVCTFTREESFDLLARVKQREPAFHHLPLTAADYPALAKHLEQGCFLSLPGQGKLDGYFIFLFEKS